MDVRRENLEFGRHNHIGELVKYDVDIDALISLARQVILEFLSDLVAFPDVRFQVDALLRVVDRGKHVVVEIVPVIVQLHHVLAHPYLLQALVRESPLRLVPLAPIETT